MFPIGPHFRIGLLWLLILSGVSVANAQNIKSYAELRKEQVAKLTEELAGDWQLAEVQAATDGKILGAQFDNSKQPALLVTFSAGKVTSKTSDNVPGLEKPESSSEMFLPGSTYKFGDNHLTQLDVELPPTKEKKTGQVIKYLYFLKNGYLYLVFDNLSRESYPADSNLIMGESVERLSLVFSRVKK
jgi:hypothetical protein